MRALGTENKYNVMHAFSVDPIFEPNAPDVKRPPHKRRYRLLLYTIAVLYSTFSHNNNERTHHGGMARASPQSTLSANN